MLWQSHDERPVIRTLEWCHAPKEVNPVIAMPARENLWPIGLKQSFHNADESSSLFSILRLCPNHSPYSLVCKTTWPYELVQVIATYYQMSFLWIARTHVWTAVCKTLQTDHQKGTGYWFDCYQEWGMKQRANPLFASERLSLKPDVYTCLWINTVVKVFCAVLYL